MSGYAHAHVNKQCRKVGIEHTESRRCNFLFICDYFLFFIVDWIRPCYLTTLQERYEERCVPYNVYKNVCNSKSRLSF